VEPNDLEFYLFGQMEGRTHKESAASTEPMSQDGLEGQFGHQL